MKIRNGFVSNSSTSSFILIGYKIKEDEYDYEKIERLNLDWTDDEEETGYNLIGKEIACWDEEDYKFFSFDWEKIEQTKKEVKEKMGMDEEPQLFGGIRVS